MRHRIINDRESFAASGGVAPPTTVRRHHPRPSRPRPDHAMDIEQARFNMVEQQIRTWDVLDQDILDLLFAVKREEFVPPAYRMLAFADLEIPLPEGERMWTPKMEARVLQELALRPGDSVLEVGTGSGYFTALLASREARVTSVEIHPRLAAEARSRLARAGFAGVDLQ